MRYPNVHWSQSLLRLDSDDLMVVEELTPEEANRILDAFGWVPPRAGLLPRWEFWGGYGWLVWNSVQQRFEE